MVAEEEKEHSGFNDDDKAKAITFIKLLPTTQTIKLKWRRVSVSLLAANCESVDVWKKLPPQTCQIVMWHC